MAERVVAYREENGLAADRPVPVDAVTASGSGLDPHISVANAGLQAPRVADARGLPLETVLGWSTTTPTAARSGSSASPASTCSSSTSPWTALMTRSGEPSLIVPLAGLAPLVAAAAMVSVRGEVEPEITVLVLALTVALGARFGGRPAGVLAAVMAALSFDFFHTRPYLSLTISDSEDILSTILLLAVALVVGGLSARATAEHQELQTIRDDGAAVRRVLLIAVKGDAEDVELAVRAELSDLLVLRTAGSPRTPSVCRSSDRTASSPTRSSATRTRASSSPSPASPSGSSAPA